MDDAGEFPNDWFWHSTADQRAAHAAMIGKPMPKLELTDWMNGELDLTEDLDGKVVVVDFWATWCRPCMSAIPKLEELAARHEDLVVIGICHTDGAEEMEQVAKRQGIDFPIARDVEGTTAAIYRVDSFPDYYLVGRHGRLRVAELANMEVERAVERLLSEPAPGESGSAPGAPEHGEKRSPQREASGKGEIQESELERGRGDR